MGFLVDFVRRGSRVPGSGDTQSGKRHQPKEKLVNLQAERQFRVVGRTEEGFVCGCNGHRGRKAESDLDNQQSRQYRDRLGFAVLAAPPCFDAHTVSVSQSDRARYHLPRRPDQRS